MSSLVDSYKKEAVEHENCKIYESSGNCYNDYRCIYCKKTQYYSQKFGLEFALSGFNVPDDQKAKLELEIKRIKTDLLRYNNYAKRRGV